METTSYFFYVDPHEINYISVTIGSYGGIAFLRTVDPNKGLVQILISPGCEEIVFELLGSLSVDEGLRLEHAGIGE